MTNNDYCFDVWTIRKVATNDFGQDHWDTDDFIDYQQNYNPDDDNDDDNNRSIEDLDNDDDADDKGKSYNGFGDRDTSSENCYPLKRKKTI
ncbi:unnamed protein product [Rotaria sp. Silwood2]|nr:unnamed protein product [Rotaria sp. Silwood2]CAF2520025.1 unnamed protein product [Rotaria sp. Silwood2]CAF2775662.1 unnamed protein product [Rotaria sp. Silwood2]CAF3530277.1 unnamed protein product [Rotaria sp. Silwood2]CAF4103740.1 unnamed protein product [Rotaria sp. Silwood2]